MWRSGGTWAENGRTISWLSSPADAHGLKMMGENSGEDDLAKMTIAIEAARSYGLSAVLWVRASQGILLLRLRDDRRLHSSHFC